MPNETTFRCTIKRMYRGCPKPDGWFGCFAHIRGSADDIKLSGKTSLPLTDGLTVDVTANETDVNTYAVSDIQIVTKTTKGLTAYLQSLPGVSLLVAKKIVMRAGIDAIDIIKQGETATKTMSDKYNLNLTNIQIKSLVGGVTSIGKRNSLLQFLPELANDKKLIKRVEMHYADPINDIKKDPYSLLEVPGIKFPTVDTIAVRLGVGVVSLQRLGNAMKYLMSSNTTGDLYINLSSDNELIDLMNRMEHLLNIQFTGMTDFGNWLVQIVSKPEYCLKIDMYKNNGIEETHLYSLETYTSMISVVNMIRISAKKHPHNNMKFADVNFIRNLQQETDKLIRLYEQNKSQKCGTVIKLQPEQRQAVMAAMTNRMSVVTGGPGRGKTMVIECIAFCWNMLYRAETLLMAPTGKAMNKLKEATGGNYNTQTIDKILVALKYAEEYKREHKNSKTVNILENPNSALIIIDESSMIDLRKIAGLFNALNQCHFCFVGDADQLPPIGAGTFFKDLITASPHLPHIPVTYLVTPLRNSGVILSNADKVNNNDTNLIYNLTDFPFFPQKADDNDALTAIIETYVDEKQETPDITDLVLLCPMRKGAVGTDSINIAIQKINCPENKTAKGTWDTHRSRENFINRGYPIPDTIFGNATAYTKLRVGDIIINTKNNYDTTAFIYENDDYFNGKAIEKTHGLFNGDCGKIIAYIPPVDPTADDESSHSYMIVQLFDGRIAELDITAGDTDNIELGYALTVHKAQGCEYKTVIYVSPKRILDLPRNGFASKNLVYTGFTRAKEKVVVIGSKDSLNLCIQSNIPTHNSNVAERMMNCGSAISPNTKVN